MDICDGGLFSGLFDGFIAIISLLIDIFWEVEVYRHCQQSWWYDFGFLLGSGFAVIVGVQSAEIASVGFIILLICYIIGLMFNFILWGIGIGIGLLIVYIIYRHVTSRH